ncbi:sugar kinase [Inediibacterium massiliense]|uniref:sugar kinase n=1 Tax=Inediibacterium massiliense TaxID=1658111 RepID=UPI0006B59B0F|nr:sugar kinase [Inediibacterium massiliense]
MSEIITIGEILVEVMAKEIEQKFYETKEFVGPFPSGAPAIFIDQAAKCESSAMIVSAVGNDGFGKINIDRLKKDNVDVSKIKILKDQTTGVAFVTYKSDGDRDFIYHISNAACGFIEKEDINEKDFMDCKYFHIMGSSIYNENIHDTILKGIELANKNNCKITFDPNVRKEIVTNEGKRKILVDILKQAHVILAGENELFYLTGIKNEKESVYSLMKEKAEIIIIKRGSKGATLYEKESVIDIDSYLVKEIDPTGAGDCFAGTFVSCINQGMKPYIAARLACIAGAKAVTRKGPMEGNTTLEELKKIYKEMYK